MHVDGFRFDLASTLARELFEVDRLGSLFRHHPSGPGAVAGQADRRAVGRRPGRLPGRQLPGAVDRVERQVPRHRPALLEGRRRHWSASSPRAWPAPATSTGTTAGSPTPASTSSPATTASRLHDLVSYNDKHNEANGEENRDGTNDNNSLELRRTRDQPTIPTSSRCAAAEAQPDRHPVPLAGRADDPRGRRAEPHPERQQQHLLPGQRADLARLGSRPKNSSRSWSSCKAVVLLIGAPSRSSSGGSSSMGRASGAPTSRTSPSSPPPDRRCRTRTGTRASARCLGFRLAGDLIDDVDKRGEPVVGETLLLL